MPKKWYMGITEHRGLPNGYTQVDYIKSSGTQYINTGFCANQNTKMVLDCDITYGSGWIMIAGSYDSNARFSWWAKATQIYVYYVSLNKNVAGESGRITLTEDKGKWTAGTSLMDFGGTTFSATSPIYLFSVNGGDGSYENATMKLYSCKIYDNDTLVRDFVPCTNSSGTVGLYDVVNGAFYANEGTGTFTVGTTVSSGGVAREIKKPYFGVANVARKVKKGYVGVDNIARQFFQNAIPIGDLEVGASVWVNINGVSTEFLVVQQGLPSSSYHASCNDTWLLAKDCYEKRMLGGGTDYTTSTLHNYLNGDFLNLFDDGVRSIIKSVTIPRTSSATMSAKVFVLHTGEVGLSALGHTFDGEPPFSTAPIGATLSYFKTNTGNAGRIAYYDGTAIAYWTRHYCYFNGNAYYWNYITSKGRSSIMGGASSSTGVRPAFIVPKETLVDGSSFEILV